MITLVTIMSYVDRTAFVILIPAMKEELGLLDTQLGLLMGVAFSFIYALCAFPIAHWADRGNRRNILFLCLTVWSAMTMLTGMAQQFWHLLIARMGVAASEAGGPTTSQSMICDLIPPHHRATAFSVFQFGYIVGSSIGAVAAGLLAAHLGWRMAFVVLGAPGFVVALAMRAMLREPPRGQFDQFNESTEPGSLLVQLNALWVRQTFRRATYFTFLLQFIFSGMAAWWPSIFTRIHGQSLPMIGFYMSLSLIGPALGYVVGGAVAHRLAHAGVRAPILLSAAGALLLPPMLIGAVLAPSSVAAVLLLSMSGFMATLPTGAVMATYQSVLDPRARATGSAITGLFSALGVGLGPVFIGMISDAFGPMGLGPALRAAMLFPAAASPLLPILLFGVARSISRDLEREDASSQTA